MCVLLWQHTQYGHTSNSSSSSSSRLPGTQRHGQQEATMQLSCLVNPTYRLTDMLKRG